MNILFVSYWGGSDGLTAATVYPNLKVLAEFSFVREIILCTIEREPDPPVDLHLPKVVHIPLRSQDLGLHLATKAGDIVGCSARVVELVRSHAIDVMICRSVMAGSIGLAAHAVTGVPFIVESFEPHAEYAVEGGAWSRYGLKAIFQRTSERLQLRFALAVMPVTHRHAAELVSRGVSKRRVLPAPCPVDPAVFGYSSVERAEVREALGLGAAFIGIYVGKFGGLYYDDEAFEIFKQCFDLISGFRLILLTPSDRSRIEAQLAKFGIDATRVCIATVPHKEVPKFLSAADFAFALYVPSPSKRAISPVKNGEYWANGLPVLLTEGVGDESEFIEAERAGALFRPGKGTLAASLSRIRSIVEDAGHRARITDVAKRYRSIDPTRRAYAELLTPLQVERRRGRSGD